MSTQGIFSKLIFAWINRLNHRQYELAKRLIMAGCKSTNLMYQQHYCSELEILTQVGEKRKTKVEQNGC